MRSMHDKGIPNPPLSVSIQRSVYLQSDQLVWNCIWSVCLVCACVYVGQGDVEPTGIGRLPMQIGCLTMTMRSNVGPSYLP